MSGELGEDAEDQPEVRTPRESHGARGRSEVMRRRLDTGSASSGIREPQNPGTVSEPGPEPASPLLEAWQRAGTCGSGVDLLQRRSASVAILPRGECAERRSVARDLQKLHSPDTSLTASFNERYINKTQTRRKLKSAKHLVYHRESEEVKSALRLARQEEWGKWQTFNAAVPIDAVELKKLLDEGYRMVPTQWIEIDKISMLKISN